MRATDTVPAARAFGAVLDRLREKRREVLPDRIGPRPRGEAAGSPLSFAQQRLWFLSQLRPDDASYNVSAAVEVRGPVDAGALADAFGQVAARHESLRTTFEEVAGDPVQVVHPAGRVGMPLIDLAGLPGGEEEAERLARTEAARPFDVRRGPLLRTALVRTGAERHLLLLTLHHLVSDAWSMGVLIKEVSAFYRTAVEGRPSLLPALTLQYADFAAWQRERLDALERPLAWWRERLAGVPPGLDLPMDGRGVSGPAGRGGRRPLWMSRELSARLDALARAEGTTLFVALLAGFQALLHRWSGQEDVVVGSPFANRRRAEVQGLIGFFVNTLPIRTSLADRPTFRELLGRVRDGVLGVHEHQEMPFERIVEELRPERASGRNPFFQVVLAFQNVPMPALNLPGLELTLRRLDAGTAMFDLTLDLEEHPDGLRGWIEHAADHFAPWTVDRLAGHLGNLLASAVADPSAADIPVADLPMLAEGERHQLVTEWNDREVAVPRLPLHRLFEEQVRVRPQAVAVEDGRRSLSYAELDARADRLARRLRTLGAGPEVPVAFCLDRSIEAVETILAILKAGSAYVPLDPSYPVDRLAWMIADSGARVLVTAPSLPVAISSPPGVATLVLGSEDGVLADLPEEVDPDGLAYIFYTSGSTGRPKGVAATHRNVVRLVRGTDFAGFGPDETYLLLAPLSFDASTLELWGPLLNGGRLAVFPARVPALDELARTIAARGVTTLWLTAGLFHQMVDARPDALRPLRRLVAGGDVLSPSHVRRALEEGIALVNGYGPTEGTTFTCCHRIREADEPVPIGRPIANARVHVVDAGLQPVPIGVAGELLAGGLGLARGYLGRPDLTAERFVPDPWPDPWSPWSQGERLYRTGDRARLLADGRIEFLGRLDRQVKIRGFRVEPGEIEAALTRHPEVADAVVVVREDGRDRRLVAYVVPRRGQELERVPGDLRRFLEPFLKSILPAPLIPSAFVVLTELPLTANGKVDRAALPKPAARRPVAGRSPAGPVEELLAGIWEEVLEVDRVGAEDGFFDLGGHSLLATRLVSRIRGVFQVELPLADLFQEPTVAAVAARIEALRHGEAPSPVLPLSPEEREAPIPLSFAQERIWLFERMHPGSPVFNMPLGVRFRGSLDVRALAAALSEVVRRHEVLRTTFPEVDGRHGQRIAAPRPIPVPVVDLAEPGISGGGAAAEIRRLAREEARRPFDLQRDVPLRALLVRMGPDEHEVLLTLHHIAADGWSLEILVRELEALYRGLPLPELPLQYADWAVWQRRRLEGGKLDGLRSAWRRLLRGAPTVLELPTDRPRPPVRSFRGAVLSVSVDLELAGELEALGWSEGCTLYMTLLAAFQVLIRSLARRDDFLVGSPVAGRSRGETDGLIGFFVNMLALRAYLKGDLPFRRLLGRVRESTLAAWEHQEMPFDELVRDLRPERDPGRAAIFQVVFAWQESAWQENPSWNLDLPGVSTDILAPPATAARYDLHLTAARTRRGLDFHLTYDAGLFEEATAAALLRRWVTLLRAACARPDDRIDRLEGGDREMQQKNLGDARERLLRVQKPKSMGDRPLVRTSGRLPLLVEPEVRDVDLVAWAAAHRGQIDEWLATHGAVLFRGFDVESIDRFREVAAAVSPDMLSYDDPTTPRTELAAKVYTSTEYPADQAIPHHNELSYNQAWPMRIFFYCVTPPESRGETPLADSRRVYDRLGLLARAVRERFVSRGVMYVRSFGDGMGLPWQTVFQTSEREGVEAYCRARGMDFEWRDGDRLRTRHVRPAVARHPRTGETVWFNQANVHHPSSLPPALRESLLAVAEDRDLPMDVNACYGDGTPIPDEDMDAVRRAYEEENVLFPWRQGDVLVADNMLVAHGRSPFSGPRKIVVLMAESQAG